MIRQTQKGSARTARGAMPHGGTYATQTNACSLTRPSEKAPASWGDGAGADRSRFRVFETEGGLT